MPQCRRKVTHNIMKVSRLDGPSCQLQQRRRFIDHVPNKTHHQWIAPQTELLQMDEAEELTGKKCQKVIVETERQQRVQPKETKRLEHVSKIEQVLNSSVIKVLMGVNCLDCKQTHQFYIELPILDK